MDDPRIDELFAGLSDAAPGCAVGVVQDGELVHAAGYGSADLEHDIRITPDTVFDIGSTSKQFTAAAVLDLSLGGALGLDDRVCDHLVVLPRDVFGEVTVRHLVHHTSGIPDYLSLMVMSGRSLSNDYEEDELVHLIARQRGLDFPAGSAFSYSNSGYLLLAELVRAVSGKSLRTFADERLFGPAGMGASFFHDDYTEVVRDRAVGYTARPDGTLGIDVPLIDVVGDGAVYTTVRDLARWDEQFYRCTLPAGPDFTQRMTQPGRLGDGTQISYALGLFVDTYRSARRVHHGGSWGGYRAQLMRFPDHRTSIIVLANSAAAPVDDYATAVADVVLGEQLAPPNDPPESAASGTVAGLASRVGTYVDERASFSCRLALEDDVPVLQLGAAGLPLRPSQDDVLLAQGIELRVVLEADDRISLTAAGLGTVRLHRHDEPDLDAESLSGLCGTYRSQELEAELRISRDGDDLQLRVGWTRPRRLASLGGLLFRTDEAVVRVEPGGGALTLGSLRSRLQHFTRLG